MLLNCAECGGRVSDKARTCPHCGSPLNVPTEGQKFVLGCLVLFVLGFILLFCCGGMGALVEVSPGGIPR